MTESYETTAEEASVPSVQVEGVASSVADILDRAADLIEPEGRWMQGDLGRDAHGERIDVCERLGDAVCFCMEGAIEYVARRHGMRPHEAFEAVKPVIANGTAALFYWNDRKGRTQTEVVAALRQAASAERAKATGGSR